MGYGGGTQRAPTYNSLGDHTESIQIDYDPVKITYQELLDIFWQSHNPIIRSWSRQYRNVIFYHNEEQKRLAIESREAESDRRGGKIHTAIEPMTGFNIAEDYHQKYRLRNERVLLREFRAMYPGEKDFMNSTAVARVNGYLGGYGTPEMLTNELKSLGLSEQGEQALVEILSESRPAFRSCAVKEPIE